MMNNIPFVSVWMVCYNHEKHIAEAIESVLSQKTSFTVKLFIGEDYSTDKTKEICLHYKNLYPEKIELFLNENNLGPMRNALQIYDACFKSEAKYVALLEGDDYWTDSLKLQKQVDFMEANKDFAICFHKMQVIYEDDSSKNYITNNNQKEVTTVLDLAGGNYIYTASCLFRNNLFNELPESFKKSPVGDYFLHILNAQYGSIKFLNEVMGVYRVHTGGIWENKPYIYRRIKWVEVQEYLYKEVVPEVKSIFKKKIYNELDSFLDLLENGTEEEKNAIMQLSASSILIYLNLKKELNESNKKKQILFNQLVSDYNFPFKTFIRNLYYRLTNKKYNIFKDEFDVNKKISSSC